MKLAVEMVDSPRHKQQKSESQKGWETQCQSLESTIPSFENQWYICQEEEDPGQGLIPFAALRGAIEMRLDEAT